MAIALGIICFIVVAFVLEYLFELFEGEDWYDRD